MAGDRRGRVTVVGAGLGGALVGILLGRAGYEVALFERRPDPRRGPVERGRSINLAISTRGLDALEQVGLARAVVDRAVPMKGRMIHDERGRTAFQPYGTEPHQVLYSVSRAELGRILVEAAEAEPSVRVHFGLRLEDVDLETATARFRDVASGVERQVEADFLVGADGAYSEVRYRMERLPRFDYSQSYLEHGYKELSIPAAGEGRFAMEPNALHIWPRGGFMTIALPNRDGSFTCTCFWPFEGEGGLLSLRTEEQVLDYFRRVFPDAVPLMPDLAREYLSNPVGSLVTIRCRPWHYRGKVVLLGDAAHAIVPFYGQGANAAFEDGVLLEGFLREFAFDPEKAFEAFENARRPHTDALADLALANFVEMRDKTASRLFRLGKAVERTLHRAMPRRFVPLYHLVTFGRTPYAEAVRRARLQWRIVRAAAGAGIVAILLLLWFGLVGR